ncbi:MAG: extracellular solute-binding protein, partial [Oscillospiraceae bacterium]|nr:extracellular solute-binding protein [Oscillospiraceae bacterium]
MKKVISALLLAVLIIPVLLAAAPKAAAETVTINVYNWGQYISDGTDGAIDVNKAFEEATGIRVNYMTYDSNETLYTKLKTGGSTYDVIIPSDYMIGRLISEGLLEKLDFSNIPNYQYIEEAYKNTAYDPTNEYSVPYTWGTVGVIYNKKYVDEADIGSWDLLWNEKYK